MDKNSISKGDIVLIILDYKKNMEGEKLKEEMAGFYRRVLSYNPKNLEMEEMLAEYSYLGFITKTQKECQNKTKTYYGLTKSGKKVALNRIMQLARNDKTYGQLENITYALGN